MTKTLALLFTVLATLSATLSQAQAAVGPNCAIRTDDSSVCVGDRVLDYRNITGFAEALYPNGALLVHYDDGTNYEINPYYVYREVAAIGAYAFGTRIYDARGNLGTVFDLFENGMIEVTFDAYPGQYYLLNLNQLTSAGLPAVPVTHAWPNPRPYPDPVNPQPVPAPDYPTRLSE